MISGLVHGICENINFRCKKHLSRGPGFYKNHCNRYWYVRRYCPKLCAGDCDGGVVKTTTKPTTTTTTATTRKPVTTPVTGKRF